jgi:hypothetical protein
MARRVNIPRTGSDLVAALIPGEIVISVAAEVPHTTHTIDVTVQLYDVAGNKPSEAQLITAWISATALAIVGTPPAQAGGPTTGTLIKAWTARAHQDILTNATGLMVWQGQQTSGAGTFYLNIAWGGIVRASGAITFSA